MEYLLNSTAVNEKIKDLPKVKEGYLQPWADTKSRAQHNIVVTSQQVLPSALVLLQSSLTRKP